MPRELENISAGLAAGQSHDRAQPEDGPGEPEAPPSEKLCPEQAPSSFDESR